jgi:hypothetical protein
MPLMPSSIVAYKCVVRHGELHVKQTTSFATSGLVSSSLSASSVTHVPQHILFILVERPFPFFCQKRKMSSSQESEQSDSETCKRCETPVEDYMTCVHCGHVFCEECDHEIQTIAPQEEYDEQGGLYNPYRYYYCQDCVSQAET